jgi:hypothetical protein
MDVAASVELKKKPSQMENGKWRNRIKQRIHEKKNRVVEQQLQEA